jgi:hypothetical protein
MGRGLLPHVVLLAVAASASVFVWTRDKKPVVSAGDVTVWNVRAAEVERIAIETKIRKVSLEAHKDGQGRWFLGTSETQSPHVPDGAPAAPKVVTFIAVAQADKVAEGLAPLKALREVGRVGDDRASEFGLKDAEGSLSIGIAGNVRRLTLGGRTPGGADRYVRDDGSGRVYVVKGDVTRDLESGESTLTERDLHGFKDADLESMRVQARGKSRTVLRRGPESKRIWADPAEPDKADETASNWVAKIDRLRPTEYLAPQPTAPEIVVRIEYAAKGVQGAFLEVAKLPPSPPPAPPPGATPPPEKPEFAVRTEHTRQWAKVYGPAAEQVEQDLASVLR